LILLDTSLLSHAFRRRRRPEDVEPEPVKVLRRLVSRDEAVAVPGVVLQELLSGVRTEAEFDRLQKILEGFPLLIASAAHHLAAARISNACRAAGITSSAVDSLIAALALESGSAVFTLDGDFGDIAACCSLQVFDWQSESRRPELRAV